MTGQNYDFSLTLVTESGEDLENAYLCVLLPEQAGIVSAKLATESEYRQVQGVWNPECFLGHIQASTQTEIDLRLSFPSGFTEGMTALTLFVGHGAAITPPSDLWETTIDDGFWSDNLTDEFWRDDWQEQ